MSKLMDEFVQIKANLKKNLKDDNIDRYSKVLCHRLIREVNDNIQNLKDHLENINNKKYQRG